VAAKSLELLLQDFEVEAIVTKPKPAHHKGDFPVLTIAKKNHLDVHTVASKSELSKLFTGRPFESTVGVLIDFGIILRHDVIGYFPKGIVNSHFSLLPEWRGPDPITFAVLSGQPTTGVSLMLLVEAMDEGPLISFGELALPPDITTPLLTDHLVQLSHRLLQAELPRYLDNPSFKPAPQSITGREVSYSRKLTKQDGLVDWRKTAAELEREVRAYLEWPKSQTQLVGKDIVITKAQVSAETGQPGKLLTGQKRLVVTCGQDALEILRLKPAGKQEMTAEAFINGHKDLLTG